VSTSNCTDRCRHAPGEPCPDFVAGLLGGAGEGPCAHHAHERAPLLRRDDVARPVIYVGTGTCGLGAGAGKTLEAVKAYVAKNALDAEVVEVGCIGLCTAEPMVDVQLPGKARVSYGKVSGDRVAKILDAHLGGKVAFEHVLYQFRSPTLASYEGVIHQDQHPFFAPQTRWVLVNCGQIDPTSIDEYLARGGYRALADTLRGKTPAEVCDVVEKAGLRGRGGGGFPSAAKWKMALAEPADQKYLICNADEGDPGAFMNRAEIEGDPHRLLEGMAIAAYAIGATKAYIYIRAEYPLAIRRLQTAIAQAKAYGFLGKNVFDSGFSIDIVLKMGAGAFVCGEETALIHSIEGKRGMPRPRPPYPTQKGAFGKPSIINNVETLFNVPSILSKGAAWFSSVGTAKAKGTKVFALSGKVNRTGLVEVPMGTPLRQVIFDIGGGIANGKAFKAVQVGGPSGGCIPAQYLDLGIDYESMKGAGAIMGSGGLVVMDEDTCMIDVARFFMDFIQRESCGKCIPCREGTRRMLEILTRLTSGRRSETGTDALHRFEGVMYLERLAHVIRDTSLCGLGQSAPNPVLSTLRHFREEYEAHVYERRCPAGACKELLSYSIDESVCKGCGVCVKTCPSEAIVGAPKQPHSILVEKCISCGTCIDVCRLGAVVAA
jgi:NADH:ubiquinone oxidoreductase subunit F (NADH-binding)/(2Fe-2S) ferredoxin